MSKPISTVVQNAIQQEEVSTRLLMELYLNVSDIPSVTLNTVSDYFSIEGDNLVFRFVANDTQDLIIPVECYDINYRGKKYVNTELTRGNIDTATDGQVEKTNIKMSNKLQEWAAIFASLGNIMNNRRCILLEYFPDFPEEPPINIFDGAVNGVKMTPAQFEWELKRSVVDFDAESPNMTYDVSCQWKFRDFHCKYSGLSIKCDKTLGACNSFSNVLNFGGHPSVPREMVIKAR